MFYQYWLKQNLEDEMVHTSPAWRRMPLPDDTINDGDGDGVFGGMEHQGGTIVGFNGGLPANISFEAKQKMGPQLLISKMNLASHDLISKMR